MFWHVRGVGVRINSRRYSGRATTGRPAASRPVHQWLIHPVQKFWNGDISQYGLRKPDVPRRTSQTGSELFIVDNSDEDWKVLRYLHDWCPLSKAIDIATGYFEIGSLLALRDEWQKVDAFRILMGDEVSKRTKAAFVAGLGEIQARLDASLESEKEKNDFLTGVPAIAEALRSGKICCRVYRKDKFHAKCYLTHARQEVVGSFGLVGSSNFTYPGITENIELNVQISGTPVAVLQEWYEQHWNDAEDVTPDILRTLERHVHEYSPFEVYAKSIQEYCRGHELTASEWELAGPQRGSRIYGILDQYQKEGYQAAMQIARRHGGAFVCDGVGLGKTFIGLMLIERLIMHEGKRVALFVPRTGRVDVWERWIKRYLPHIGGVRGGDFSSLVIFNHTDLGRGGDFPYRFERIKEMADAIVIDEAHHFRNLGRSGKESGGKPSRYYQLDDLIEGPRGTKEVFLLTATPINNSLHDFRHMAELFTRRREDFLAQCGIHSFRGHFVSLEKTLLKKSSDYPLFTDTNLAEVDKLFAHDKVFKELVVQRSRAYVRRSQMQQGGDVATFPERQPPQVADYSVKKTYGRLLDTVDTAFAKEEPLFVLGIYYPLHYYNGPKTDIDPLANNRQIQVCGLIRTQFLKRFESSAHAFEQSCDRLLIKLLAWSERHSQTDHEKQHLTRWKLKHADLIGYVHQRQRELFPDEDEAEADEDLITPEMLEDIDELDRDEYDVHRILEDTREDLNQVAEFLEELRKFKPQHDDKLKALIKLLKNDPVMKKHKVLIFTEFAETARYLHRELAEAGIKGVEQIDSGKKDRGDFIHRFSPYYNGTTSAKLAEEGRDEIRILISTDVLSEGLNLQDCTRLINYDLHWNPVRLMQRIGRVDRRLNPEVEKQLVADHPDQKPLRGQIAYHNFLPPDELETLLSLYGRVSHKTLQISKTLGIEGRKLLRPEDDYEALKDFNETYEGTTTTDEEIRLELQAMLGSDGGLAARLDALPGRVFSGKRHPQPGTQSVFFCYRLPRPDHAAGGAKGELPWTEEAGETRWYLHRLSDGQLLEEASAIIDAIRSSPDTPRHCAIPQTTLAEIRGKVEKHIKNSWLKRMQAPIGVKPILKAWMELN
ncbi:MAG: helicase [Planctomycetota bacterium]|nr:MAG: helicase [Planctomycetota bacterium]